jgi:hypothetical protein
MDNKIPLEELQESARYHIEREQEFFQLVEDASFLNDSSKKRFRKYIESFYKLIKDDKKLKRLVK